MKALPDYIKAMMARERLSMESLADRSDDLNASAIQRLLEDKEDKSPEDINPTFRTLIRLQKALELDTHTYAHLVFDLPLPQKTGEVEGVGKAILELLKRADDNQSQEILDFAEFVISKGKRNVPGVRRKKSSPPSGLIRGNDDLIPGGK